MGEPLMAQMPHNEPHLDGGLLLDYSLGLLVHFWIFFAFVYKI